MLVNFVFSNDQTKHVVELQIQHDTLVRVRKEGAAHEKYNEFRAAFELLETIGEPPVDGEVYKRPKTVQQTIMCLEDKVFIYRHTV